MKRLKVVELILLSVFLLSSVPTVSKANADLLTPYSVPEEICKVEPIPTIPENFTEDYVNTTNLHSNIVSPMSAIDEVDDAEGNHPLYVLVCGDEEERTCIRQIGPEGQYPVSYDKWAKMQIERGDEALVANFGIDIRILGFIEWDSDDSKTTMTGLWFDLESKTSQYLRQWYDGEWWSNYVDAIIGMTAQATPDEPNIPGKAPGPEYLDQGRTFILVKWQVYWMDDNIVQHEISHLFYADDHWYTCCVMAGHTHSQTWIWEDGLWWVFNDIPCAYTAYSWCNDCFGVIEQNSGRYVLQTLTISASSTGTTIPAPGTYTYNHSSSVTVTASAYYGCYFSYWSLDGATVYGNPITVTMNSDHTLIAYFRGGGCPTLFVWNGTSYVEEDVLDIHAESDVTVQHQIQNILVLENGVYKLQLRELDEYTSHIDQVKLYAVDNQGKWHLCPLTYAYHSSLGKVKQTLLLDDGNRVDLKPTETIDLKFAPSRPYSETAYFIFEINGYNLKPIPL